MNNTHVHPTTTGAIARLLVVALIAAVAFLAMGRHADAASRLQEFLPKVQPGELFQGADRFGEPAGEPPMVPVLKGDEVVGQALLNSDFTSAIGYSGKPIHIVVGLDPQGVLRGLKMVDHQEPIVLIGIPEADVIASLNALIDKDIGRVASGEERPPQVDIVSGATVTVLVMGDSVVRAAVRVIRSGRLGGNAPGPGVAAPAEIRTLDMENTQVRDWATLIGDGSIRSLGLTVGEVTEAFARNGEAEAAARPENRALGKLLSRRQRAGRGRHDRGCAVDRVQLPQPPRGRSTC